MNKNGNFKFPPNEVFTGKLTNGLRIIHQFFPSEISYCGIAVNTGNRDENPDEHGMAHFIEHLLFKGTKKRKAHHIIGRMENVGGELNAYTTKEETFIYATFLNEYFERAVELLSDVIFNSTFPENQIDKEREVILDEINSYIDSPSELIFDDFENLIYENHEIGHYILGTPETLNRFDAEKVRNFFHRQYQPSNMVLFSFGKLPFSKVMRLSEKYFEFDIIQNEKLPFRQQPVVKVLRKLSVNKKTAQAHVLSGNYSYDMFHRNRYALSLLNNVLGGGGINSRLNNSLREKNGLVYHVESLQTSYTDTGFFSIYFACDHDHVQRCLKLIGIELQKLRDKPLSATQLAIAKRQYKGQIGIATQNNESVALQMAKYYLHHKNYLSLDDIFQKYDSITANELQEVANNLFKTDELFEIRYI